MSHHDSKLHIRTEQSFSILQEQSQSSQTLRSVDTAIIYNNNFDEIIDELSNKQKRSCMVRRTQTNISKEDICRQLKSSQVTQPNSRKPIKIPESIKRVIYQRFNCLNLSTTPLLNSIYGAFFGFAIGDSIGAYVAYQNLHLGSVIPAALLMKAGGAYNLGSAQGTDQTQIMLTTAYGLIQCESNYNQLLMTQNYLKWVQSKPFDLPVLMALSLHDVKKYKAGNPHPNQNTILDKILSASFKNSKHESILGLVRIVPLTVYGLNLIDKQFIQLIKEQMQLICPNQLVIETAVIYARFLKTIFITQNIQKAFYEASKWISSEGSQKMKILWDYIENGIAISSQAGKLNTAFSYPFIECHQPKIDFVDSLLNIMIKGGDTDSNCAITMALIGAIVGYNGIPSYYRKKIIQSNLQTSLRPRNQSFQPNKILEVIPKLIKVAPYSFESKLN